MSSFPLFFSHLLACPTWHRTPRFLAASQRHRARPTNTLRHSKESQRLAALHRSGVATCDLILVSSARVSQLLDTLTFTNLVLCFHKHSRFVRSNSSREVESRRLRIGKPSAFPPPDFLVWVSNSSDLRLLAWPTPCFHRHSRFVPSNSECGKYFRESPSDKPSTSYRLTSWLGFTTPQLFLLNPLDCLFSHRHSRFVPETRRAAVLQVGI